MYPILFQIAFFTIKTRWLLITLGVTISVALFLKTAKRKKLNLDIIHKNFLLIVLITLVAARLGFAVNNYLIYGGTRLIESLKGAVYIWNHDWSFNSGLISAILIMCSLILKNQKDQFSKWADTATIPLLLLLAFSHLGDFFEGTDYGKPSQTPWALTFQNILVAYTVPIHPSQIYAVLYTIIIMLIIKPYHTVIDHVLPKSDGQNALFALWLYSFFRFLEEFTRGDEVIRLYSIRLPLIVSFLLFVVSLVMIYYFRKKLKNPTT